MPATVPYRQALAIDLDGVLHRYSKGWHTKDIYDPPMDGAADALDKLAPHYNLYILTARPAEQTIEWCRKQFPNHRFELIPRDTTLVWWDRSDVIGVSNLKLPALAYIDDRAVRFTNWTDILNRYV